MWSKADVLARWIQIVRGPRPHSEQWLRAVSVRSSTTADGQVCQGQGQPREQDPQAGEGSRRSDSSGPSVDAFKSELEKAQNPPLKVQITSTQDFIRRSERRVAELEAERIAESELLEEAREWLRHLEAARSAEESAIPSPPATPMDLGAQVQILKQMVSQLQEERDALANEVQGDPVERSRVRQRLSAPHVSEDVIPPMPTLVPRELSEWMEDRQSDMQEAMSSRNLKKLLELTSLQGQAAKKLAEMTGCMVY